MLDQTIAHYKITSKLGQGGMGEVYRATDTLLERKVAIKVLSKYSAEDSNRSVRFTNRSNVPLLQQFGKRISHTDTGSSLL